MHARPIRIEDARDLDRQSMLPPIVHEERFGAALAFVVTRTRTDRIHIAPVRFLLRMHVRVAIDFARRGLKDFRVHALGEPEHVDRAVHARLRRLHRIVLVMDRRSGAREVVDLVDFHVERKGHVMTHQLEVRAVEQMRDVVLRAGVEVVDA